VGGVSQGGNHDRTTIAAASHDPYAAVLDSDAPDRHEGRGRAGTDKARDLLLNVLQPELDR